MICICFNHQNFVTQALQSVIDQSYPHVELIVVDNGSTDESVLRISEFSKRYPTTNFIRNVRNCGLNRAFNQALVLAKGQYIIDLSADDLLLPHRISRQVAQFSQLPVSYGVVFSNAAYIDANGQQTGYHYTINAQGNAHQPVPTGDVFMAVLASYFICTPTMMMRRDMLLELGGYDETLAYEDFDFWVRSSRRYQYAHIDEVLTHKRQLTGSLSTQITVPDNPLLTSTLCVCQKALALCRTDDERKILAIRVQAFIRKCFYAEQFDLAFQFEALLHQITPPGSLTRLVLYASRQRIRVNVVYRWYLKRRTKPV